MVRLSTYKGVFAVEICFGNISAKFLPGEGGKLASFKADGYEFLLQNPSSTFLRLGKSGDYVACECAGFDDMFPTIDPCAGTGGKAYPDHGEVCRMPWAYEIIGEKTGGIVGEKADEKTGGTVGEKTVETDGGTTGEKIAMKFVSEKFGYRIEKTIGKGDGDALEISYEIENTGREPLPCLYAAHCLVNAENGGKIIVPFRARDEINAGDETKVCGEINAGDETKLRGEINAGDETELFFDTTATFPKGEAKRPLRKEMLNFPARRGEKRCYKLYFPAKCGDYAIGFKPEGKPAFMINVEGLPFAGIWVNDDYFNGARCVGIEPCSARYDSPENAEKRGEKTVLLPREKLKFKLGLSVEKTAEKV